MLSKCFPQSGCQSNSSSGHDSSPGAEEGKQSWGKREENKAGGLFFCFFFQISLFIHLSEDPFLRSVLIVAKKQCWVILGLENKRSQLRMAVEQWH